MSPKIVTRKTPPLKYFEEVDIALGPKQEEKLKLIGKRPESINILDNFTKNRFLELGIIDKNGVTQVGQNIIQYIDIPDMVFDNYGGYLRWRKENNKKKRKNRTESPCGCDCNGCLRHCRSDTTKKVTDDELPRIEGETDEEYEQREYFALKEKYTTYNNQEEMPNL